MKGLLYFNFTDVGYSMTIFWTILMSMLVVSLIVTYFMRNIEGSMTFTLTAPMYVYCAILGFLPVKESIPFSLKRGATRKNIIMSLGIFFLGISIIKSTVGSTLQVIIDLLVKKIGVDNFTFLHVSYLTNDTWINRILIDITIMWFLFSFMFVLSLIFYRYGILIGGAFIGLLLILILTGFAQGWLTEFLVAQFQTLDQTFYIQLFVISMIIYGISFFYYGRSQSSKITNKSYTFHNSIIGCV